MAALKAIERMDQEDVVGDEAAHGWLRTHAISAAGLNVPPGWDRGSKLRRSIDITACENLRKALPPRVRLRRVGLDPVSDEEAVYWFSVPAFDPRTGKASVVYSDARASGVRFVFERRGDEWIETDEGGVWITTD